jgi:4-amino-4-deoxy-L-arabinose transferase-like glycosyltransferase
MRRSRPGLPSRYLLLTLILLTGAAVRFIGINAVSLRGDEAFTVLNWMREPLSQTLSEIAPVDPQPPLAYAAFWAYGPLAGTGEGVVRFLPALASLLGIPALFVIGARLHSARVGLLCALLWALSPNQVWHAGDARNYALWASASAIALACGLRAVQTWALRDWAGYAVAAAVAGYLYYLEIFNIAAFSLFTIAFLLLHRRTIATRGRVLLWVGVQVSIIAVLALWYLQPRLLFSSGYTGTAGAVDPLRLFTWFTPTLVFGDVYSPPLLEAVGIVLCLVLALCAWVCWGRRAYTALMWCALSVAVPFAAISIVSLRLNVFTPRYVLGTAPALIVLLALGLFLFASRSHSAVRLLARGGIVGLLLFQGVGLFSFRLVNDYTKAPDWRTLTGLLAQYAAADDLAINTSADEAYTFYHTERGVSAHLMRLPANRFQTEDEISALLHEAAQTHETLWLLAETPGDWPNRTYPQMWLDQHTQRLLTTRIDRLPVLAYRAWEVGEAEAAAAQPPLAPSARIPVLGSSLFGWDDTLTVLVYWQPDAPLSAQFKVFLHLVAAEDAARTAAPVAQDDQFPQDGRTTTRTWERGRIYRDVYTLPMHTIPPGEYTLWLGLYDPETGARVQLENGADAVHLRSVTVPAAQ